MPLTLARLKELLNYDPETGEFRWKVSKRGIKAGALAGYMGPKGYRVIMINKRNYAAHRLAWLLSHGKWPRREIDHANVIKSDNRLANLREATHAQNSRNSLVRKNNRSGFKGVDFSRNQWRASIMIDGTARHLGRFPTAEEAHLAYREAARRWHGQFARTE